jgi:glutathione S-transferase
MVPDYRLFCTGESGNCYKVALMLTLTACDWQPVAVDYFGGETKSEKYRRDVSVMGEIPVLEHRGERLTQSGVILDYLAEMTGQFGGRDAGERREIWRWILFDNHKFTSYLGTLRFLVGMQQSNDRPVIEFLQGRVRGAFGVANEHLRTHSFMLGDRPTIADLSMAGYLYYPEETGVDRSAFPQLEAWVQRIANLPRWKPPYELMPRGLKA